MNSGNDTSYTLCWQNISVWRKRKLREGIFRKTEYADVQILNNVSGYVSPGSLVAIMGPSGSGKTTLLATISYRLKDEMNGNVFLNGDITNYKQMLCVSGFIPQEDLTVKSLTVFEHMIFMAKLKMDKRIPKMQRLKKVITLIDQFGLTDNESTIIRSLSGGQRKRLSIAVQLLNDPYLLFCDEATTGLDSSNALIVINILRKLSSQGKIVICSIHQPASGLFELFDNVLLLATGGRVVYFGSMIDTIGYFERLHMKCPSSYNLAEFLIKKISISEPFDNKRVTFLCDAYSSSKQAAIVKEKIDAVSFEKYLSSSGKRSFFLEKKTDLPLSYQKQPHNNYHTIERVNLFTQVYYLLWRALKNLKQNYIHNLVHFAIYVSVAFIIAAIYPTVVHNDLNRAQNIRGFINIAVLETLYEFAYFVFNTFPSERALLMREISAGLYSAEAYYISKFISQTFYCSIAPIVFIVIINSISDAFVFLTFFEIAVPFSIIAILSSAYGFMMSAVFDNLSVLMSVAVCYETIAYLFAGITLKISSLPSQMNWLKYFSTFYYAIEVVTVMEWRSIDIEAMKHLNISRNDPDAFHSLQLVENYGYSIRNYAYNLYILTVLVFLFHIIAYLSIRRKSKRQAAY